MSRLSDHLTARILAAVGAALSIGAVAAALLLSSPIAASAASSTTVSARKTPVGTILEGPGGQVLYAFTRDRRDRDVCVSIRGCILVWPMVVAHGSLQAGPGVTRSRLSTITVKGMRQVTYDGHPLYTFDYGGRPGNTSYVGEEEYGGT